MKDAPRRQPVAIVENLEDADVTHRVGRELAPTLRHVEQALVRRKGKAVRPLEVVGHHF